jgi:hypothetical protein
MFWVSYLSPYLLYVLSPYIWPKLFDCQKFSVHRTELHVNTVFRRSFLTIKIVKYIPVILTVEIKRNYDEMHQSALFIFYVFFLSFNCTKQLHFYISMNAYNVLWSYSPSFLLYDISLVRFALLFLFYYIIVFGVHSDIDKSSYNTL